MANRLYRCPVRVRPGPNCEGPRNWIGACVDCYVGASDHLTAVKLAAKKLAEEGWLFEDLPEGKVHQLDPLKWQESVSSMRPEIYDRYPSQADVLKLVESGGVFFGPFCGWESES